MGNKLYLLVLSVILFQFNLDAQEVSFKERMTTARNLDNIPINQIERLKSILDELETTDYTDTIGFANYFIAYRYAEKIEPIEPDSAVVYAQKALDYFKLSNYADIRNQRSLNYLINSFNKLNRYTESIRAYQKYRSEYELTNKNIKPESQLARVVSQCYRILGDNEAGLNFIQGFLNRNSHFEIPDDELSNIYLECSLLEFNSGFYKSSRKSLNAAYRHENLFNNNSNISRLSILINQDALLLSAVGKQDEAMELYNSFILKDINVKERFVLLSNAYNSFYKAGQYEVAAPYARQAFDLNNEFDNSVYFRFASIYNLSESYRTINQLDSAIYYGNYGIEYLKEQQNLGTEVTLPLLQLYHNQILNYLALFNQSTDTHALDNAQMLMNTIDTLLPFHVKNLIFEGSLVKNKQEIAKWYDSGAELATIKNNADLFIQFSDQTKSLSFLSNRRYFNPEMQELIRQESEIEMQLALDSTLVDSLTSLLLDNRERQRVSLTNESSNSLITLSNDINDIKIDADVSILYYHKTDTVYYACHIRNNSKQLVKLGTVEELSPIIQSFNEQVREKIFDPVQSSRIFNAIIKPFGELSKRISFIPDQELSLIPFESLVMDDGTFMIENHEISYALSFNHYINSSRTSSTNIDNFYVVSPDYNENYISDLSTTKGIATLADQFSFLEHTKEEVQYLKNELDANTIEGFDITKDTFFGAFSKANIFHFTGHAVSLLGNDNLSFLALGESGDKVDQDIFIREIAEYPTNASLVMLNACNTGTGRVLKGEGVYNLARSFFKAGAKSVVSGLWEIDDYSSSEITKSFYRYLKEGKGKSKALQLAKLDYLKSAKTDQQRNPYYWAGLILTGNNDAIYSSFLSTTYLLGFLMIAGLFIFLIRRLF